MSKKERKKKKKNSSLKMFLIPRKYKHKIIITPEWTDSLFKYHQVLPNFANSIIFVVEYTVLYLHLIHTLTAIITGEKMKNDIYRKL